MYYSAEQHEREREKEREKERGREAARERTGVTDYKMFLYKVISMFCLTFVMSRVCRV